MKRMFLILIIALTLTGCVINLKPPDESGKTKPGDDPKNTMPIEQMPQVLAANEIAAMARLRSIATAEAVYYAEGDGSYATLEELLERGLMHDPMSGRLRGYRIDLQVKSNGFEATAVPEKYRVTGRRSFYIDETGVMRAADKEGEPAVRSDPEIY